MFNDATESRDQLTISKIRTLLTNDHQLGSQSDAIDVSVEESDVILRGQLPSKNLKEQLVSLVRRAGVLCRIRNQVTIRS